MEGLLIISFISIYLVTYIAYYRMQAGAARPSADDGLPWLFD